MFGQVLTAAVPALAGVLKDGAARHDVWLESNEKKVMETAAAAIRNRVIDNLDLWLECFERKALDTADQAYVLENGRVTIEGDASAIAADPRVKRAYLGL